MKWKDLFNRSLIASKFLHHNSLSPTEANITREQSNRGQLGGIWKVRSHSNRVHQRLNLWESGRLLLQACKNTIKKNPYLTLTIAFISWMLFFDSADLITQYKLTRQIKKLREEQNYYLKQIEVVTKERQELMSSEELLEKFAREKYLMKKPTEDIYIIEE
jgi:cell division protein FtsB